MSALHITPLSSEPFPERTIILPLQSLHFDLLWLTALRFIIRTQLCFNHVHSQFGNRQRAEEVSSVSCWWTEIQRLIEIKSFKQVKRLENNQCLAVLWISDFKGWKQKKNTCFSVAFFSCINSHVDIFFHTHKKIGRKVAFCSKKVDLFLIFRTTNEGIVQNGRRDFYFEFLVVNNCLWISTSLHEVLLNVGVSHQPALC